MEYAVYREKMHETHPICKTLLSIFGQMLQFADGFYIGFSSGSHGIPPDVVLQYNITIVFTNIPIWDAIFKSYS